MKKLNPKGFGLIEGLLILIAVTLIAFVGYYVHHAQQANNTNQAPEVNSKAKTTPASSHKIADPTDAWTKYSGTNVAFKFPATWVKNECDVDTVLLGPNSGSAGHCQSDATPEVFVSVPAGDRRADNHLSTADYPDHTISAVTISGIQGTKETGTLNSSQQVFVGPSNGTKAITYLFYKNGRTYVFSYNQTPEMSDVSSDFNLLVTSTLQFK